MPSVIQRSFAGGEIAPALYGRVDQAKYATGLKTCENFLVQRHGGAANRPGLQFVAEVKDSATRCRLLKFVFNDEQTYVIEAGHEYFRFIRWGGQLEDPPGTPYEIATPYAAADLPRLQYVQSGDVVTIVHRNYRPRDLSRFGHTDWTLTPVSTVPSIATPTGVTVTAGGSGSQVFRYRVTALAEDTYEESAPSAIASVTAAAPTAAAPHTIKWTAVAGAAEYYVYKELNGVYGYVGTAVGTEFRDTNIIPDVNLCAPEPQDLFTDTGDYPATVMYFQQRKWYGNTLNNPEKLWASRSASYNSFSTRRPLQADDALALTIAGRQVNEIRGMVDLGRLVVFTSGAEYFLDGDADGVLRPGYHWPRAQTYNGSGWLPPLVVGDTALYLQARGSIVRDLGYQMEGLDRVGSNDLTIFATHLFNGYQIEEWDYAQVPNSIVWAVRDDGTLLGLTYVRDHRVWGWHRHVTDGAFESVVVVPEGHEDVLYCIVRRTINGQPRRYIERLTSRQIDERTDIRDLFFVDSGLSYDGRNHDPSHTLTLSGGSAWTYDEELTLASSKAGYFGAGDVGNAWQLEAADGSKVTVTCTAYSDDQTVTVTANKTVPESLRDTAVSDWAKAVDDLAGLDHLEGKYVAVFADGNVVDNGLDEAAHQVTNGRISLAEPAAVIHVGLPYVATMETLNLDDPAGETLADKKKLVRLVTLLVESTRGVFVGPDAEHLQEYHQREHEDWGEPTRLKTGYVEIPLNSTWDDNGRIVIRQRDPLPLTVLAAVPSGEIGW